MWGIAALGAAFGALVMHVRMALMRPAEDAALLAVAAQAAGVSPSGLASPLEPRSQLLKDPRSDWDRTVAWAANTHGFALLKNGIVPVETQLVILQSRAPLSVWPDFALRVLAGYSGGG